MKFYILIEHMLLHFCFNLGKHESYFALLLKRCHHIESKNWFN